MTGSGLGCALADDIGLESRTGALPVLWVAHPAESAPTPISIGKTRRLKKISLFILPPSAMAQSAQAGHICFP